MTENAEKITYKSNKEKIWKAYKRTLEQLEQKDEVLMNVDKAKADTRRSEVMASVDANGNLSIGTLIETLMEFEKKTTETKDKYDDLCEAINIKQEELKEIYDIEKAAHTLAALLDAHNTLVEELKNEKQGIIDEYKQRIEDVQLKLEKAQTELNERIKKSNEEFEYEFDRTKMKKNDELEDELNKKRKYHKLAIEGLYDELQKAQKSHSEKISEFEKEKGEFDELKAKVESFPETLKAAEETAVSKAMQNERKRFEVEKKFYQLEKDGEIARLTNEVSNLMSNIEVMKETEKRMAEKLDAAYKEIKTLASDTVKGAANSEMFEKMKSMIDTGNKVK